MRHSITLLLTMAALFLSSCGDLVLFSQKIEGRDPVSLEGTYIVEFKDENQVLYDTLNFHRVLPYQFIVYSSEVKREAQQEDPEANGMIFQGEIHQKGNHYFLQKKDKESGKWEISSFRITETFAQNLIPSLYYREHNEILIELIKEKKLKVEKEYERKAEGEEDGTYKVYEVSTSASKAARIWKKINRKAEKQKIRKMEEVSPEPEILSELGTARLAMIYPNPSSGIVNVEMPLSGTWEVRVMDLNGKLISVHEFQGKAQQIDLSGLADGTYVLNATDAQQQIRHSLRLIKE